MRRSVDMQQFREVSRTMFGRSSCKHGVNSKTVAVPING